MEESGRATRYRATGGSVGHCHACGRTIARKVAFCGGCGARLDGQRLVTARPVSEWHCGECSTQNCRDDVYCVECGRACAPPETPPAAVESTGAQSARAPRRWGIRLAAVAIVALGIVVAVVVLSLGETDPHSASAQSGPGGSSQADLGAFSGFWTGWVSVVEERAFGSDWSIVEGEPVTAYFWLGGPNAEVGHPGDFGIEPPGSDPLGGGSPLPSLTAQRSTSPSPS